MLRVTDTIDYLTGPLAGLELTQEYTMDSEFVKDLVPDDSIVCAVLTNHVYRITSRHTTEAK